MPTGGGLRRQRAIGIGASTLMLISACGSSDGAPTVRPVQPFSIETTAGPTTSTTPTIGASGRLPAAQRFTVDADAPVLWGLEQTAVPSNDEPVYPVKVSDDGRYLVDQTGAPWRVQADAGWLMSSEGTREQVEQYLDTRHQQHFNAFYLMGMVHPGGYPEATHAPNDRDGDPPFATPNDFSTAGASPASERYWQWIDWIVAEAAKRHIVVMLAYTYLGFSGGAQGWWDAVNAQANRDVLYRWGKWLGDRYRDDPNIMWFGLGDFAPPAGSEGALRVRAIAQGIKDAGAKQLFMAESSPPDSLPTEVPDFADLLDQNSFYGWGPEGKGAVYLAADRAWKSTPIKPAWMEEGTYEYDNLSGNFSGESWDTRRGRFWSVLAGGTAGDGFGSHDVWVWKDVPGALTTPGAAASAAAFDLFASMPWWTLVPSGTAPTQAGLDLVASGQGSWGGDDYVTSARTADRQWLLAYVPVTKQGARTITVDLSAMAGPSRARWWDPVGGNYITIAGAERLPNGGRRDFTTPGLRGDSTDDWVLVLDTAGPSPCGTITSDGEYTPPSVAPTGHCAVTATAVDDPSVIERFPLTG